MIVERSQLARYLIALAIALVVIGLIAFARGADHRRGDDVGALPSAPVVVSTSEEAMAWLN